MATPTLVQTITHDRPGDRVGNCVAACVAAFFDVPLSEVPHFVELGICLTRDKDGSCRTSWRGRTRWPRGASRASPCTACPAPSVTGCRCTSSPTARWLSAAPWLRGRAQAIREGR